MNEPFTVESVAQHIAHAYKDVLRFNHAEQTFQETMSIGSTRFRNIDANRLQTYIRAGINQLLHQVAGELEAVQSLHDLNIPQHHYSIELALMSLLSAGERNEVTL